MNTPTKPADPNAKHLVLQYTNTTEDNGKTYTYKTCVYLLNPGDFFHGFGGSRHARAVTKTASLITRTTGPWGLRDLESDLTCSDAWDAIRNGIAGALTPSMGNHVKLKP
jgi:hypothetical protein